MNLEISIIMLNLTWVIMIELNMQINISEDLLHWVKNQVDSDLEIYSKDVGHLTVILLL